MLLRVPMLCAVFVFSFALHGKFRVRERSRIDERTRCESERKRDVPPNVNKGVSRKESFKVRMIRMAPEAGQGNRTLQERKRFVYAHVPHASAAGLS